MNPEQQRAFDALVGVAQLALSMTQRVINDHHFGQSTFGDVANETAQQNLTVIQDALAAALPHATVPQFQEAA